MRRGRKKEPREYVEMRMKQLMEERQKANDKISAHNKLKALGLTDAEIKAL